MGDTLPDPASEAPFEALEEASLREDLRATLDTVAGELLTEQQQTIYRSLINGMRRSEIAAGGEASVQYQANQIFEILRDDPRILQLWLDLTEQRETLAEIADRYSRRGGAHAFQITGASSVEKSVLRILQNRDTTRAKRAVLQSAMEKKLHAAAERLQQEQQRQQRRQMLSDLAAFEKDQLNRCQDSDSQKG